MWPLYINIYPWLCDLYTSISTPDYVTCVHAVYRWSRDLFFIDTYTAVTLHRTSWLSFCPSLRPMLLSHCTEHPEFPSVPNWHLCCCHIAQNILTFLLTLTDTYVAVTLHRTSWLSFCPSLRRMLPSHCTEQPDFPSVAHWDLYCCHIVQNSGAYLVTLIDSGTITISLQRTMFCKTI